jgi:NAD(P)-dependent dehydrogenase (short-subunit alcohol dehydrogenase family)
LIDLSGKHIFIAGGSRGIGAAAARMAAACGGWVTVTYERNEAAAREVVNSISEGGGVAISLQCSVTDEASVKAAMETAVDKLGSIHGLVVSAGIYEGADLEEMTVDFWDRTMSINLKGTFIAVQTAVKYMREAAGGGSIVIYTSTAGQSGSPGHSAYAASKAAQIVFMRSMAYELAGDKIRSNCIAPAWTETDMAADSLDKLGREKVARDFPLGRIGLPGDVAGATCFLLSDLAGFITGVTLSVDGGMAMRG